MGERELWRLGATELAERIRAKEVSSREVVQAHLDRIEAVNPVVNAVTRVLAEEALAAADVADARTAEGPLHGVPITVKENIDLAGAATTQGVPALAAAVSAVDAPVVERMRAAGAIPIARTNLPEFGLRVSTVNPLHGRTWNPWDRTRVAGGSSGGEGAALATGMSPLGLGNDIGGSLRNPAYCCGVASLKPTTGRVPHFMSMPPQDGGVANQVMLAEGPMARTVADVQLAYGILSGRDARDPFSVDAPLTGPVPTVRRAAVLLDVPGGPVDPSVSDAVRAAGAALEAAGWEVVEAVPPELPRLMELWARTLGEDLGVMLPLMEATVSPELVAMLRRLEEPFDVASMPMPMPMVHAERSRLMRAWAEFLGEHQVLVAPTWTQLPFEHDADLREDGVELLLDLLRCIVPGNILGIPAACVPCGLADGRPRGVQLYADRWREDLCLDAAAVVEAAFGVLTPTEPVTG
ncbi:MAG: amidase [Pseudomonadales bacterium]|jgi:amidase|nr:amidase [Pseudomonadales bacterium]